MAKFDFNNSRYARFFSSKNNSKFLRTFLDQTDIFFTNHGWYKTQGSLAPDETPIDGNGTATFNVKARKLKDSPMMDMRAPLGDTNQKDNEGIDFYTASIPDFATPGIVETAPQRMAKERKFEEFGEDADIVAAWTQNVQEMKDSVDATYTYLTAQLMTTGKLDYTKIGRGIRTVIHGRILSDDNFKTAGKVSWLDTQNCNLLNVMRVMEAKYREEHNSYTGPLVWQMTRNFYLNYFLMNKSIIDFVQVYRDRHHLGYVKEGQVVQSEWEESTVDLEGLSPIQLVTEHELNKTHTNSERIQGWADNIVVLRPAGDAVEFEHKPVTDQKMIEKYGSKFIEAAFSPFDDGFAVLANTTLMNGRFREWHTDVLSAALPALVDFPNHWIIDASKTD